MYFLLTQFTSKSLILSKKCGKPISILVKKTRTFETCFYRKLLVLTFIILDLILNTVISFFAPDIIWPGHKVLPRSAIQSFCPTIIQSSFIFRSLSQQPCTFSLNIIVSYKYWGRVQIWFRSDELCLFNYGKILKFSVSAPNFKKMHI